MPYVTFPYGLSNIIEKLEMPTECPEWTQVVRAATILVARVEDLVGLRTFIIRQGELFISS